MEWVHARRVPAEMVDLLPVGDRSEGEFICHAMRPRSDWMPSIGTNTAPKPAVTSPVLRTRPDPASPEPSGQLNLVHEAINHHSQSSIRGPFQFSSIHARYG